MKICIVNGCAAYGGVERLIEAWVAGISKDQFSFSYLYTPFPQSEIHHANMEKRVENIIPMLEWVPWFFPRNATERNNPTLPDERLIERALPFYKRIIPTSCDAYVWQYRGIIRGAKIMKQHLRHILPDVLHFNVAVNTWLSAGIVAARKLGIPVIAHIHNPPVFHKLTSLDRTLLRYISQFIFVSENTARAWEHLLPTRSRIKVIHNAVDTSKFLHTHRPSPKKAFAFGVCTRLTPMKAIDVMIQALAQAKAQSSLPLTLYIVGDGHEKDGLQHLSEKLGISDDVIFMSHQENIRPVLNQFNVYLQTSRTKEGLPIALLEAMATGLPCIATDVGGTCEAVVHEKTGIIIPIDDISALSDTMIKLSTDPVRCREMGQAAHEIIDEKFCRVDRGLPE